MKWNELPIELREIESISEYRSKVEAYLWSTIMVSNGEDVEGVT